MSFDHFDVIAGLYDRAASFTVDELLLELLSPPSDGRLLDAGGGTGRVAVALRSMVREVVVADLSRGMLKHAVQKDLGSVCSLVERLPFPSGSFDRIIMVDAFHHVVSQQETARELWRLLAPGGRVVVVEPDINRFMVKLIAIGEKLLLMRSHFRTGEKIAALFQDPGSVVSITRNEFSVLVLAEKVR